MDRTGRVNGPFKRLKVMTQAATIRAELHAEGFAGSLTLEKLSNATGARTIDIGGAIKHLVGLGLLGVKPGRGPYRRATAMIDHEYEA